MTRPLDDGGGPWPAVTGTNVSGGIDRRPTFRDPAIEAAFSRDGFTVFPFVDPGALDAIRRRVEPLVPLDAGPFFSLYRNDGPALRRQLDEVVMAELAPILEPMLDRQRLFLASALVKFPGEGSSLALHQDWSFVDESRFVNGLLWLPLEAVDATNGGLHAVAGSHRLDQPHRGSPPGLLIEPAAEERIRAGYLTQIDVPAGHAVAYHDAVIHGSCSNTSDRPRVALVVGFVSEEAELVHHVVGSDGRRWRYRVDESFFFDYEPAQGPQASGVLEVEPWEHEQRAVSVEDVGRLEPAPEAGGLARRRSAARFPGERAGWTAGAWLVLVDGRVELAGNADLDGVPLTDDDVADLVSLTAGGRCVDALRHDLALGLRRRRWAANPSPVSAPVIPLDPITALDPSIHLSIPAPLVLRIDGGAVLAWSGARRSLVALPDEAVAALCAIERLGTVPAAGWADVGAVLVAHGLAAAVDAPPGWSPPVVDEGSDDVVRSSGSAVDAAAEDGPEPIGPPPTARPALVAAVRRVGRLARRVAHRGRAARPPNVSTPALPGGLATTGANAPEGPPPPTHEAEVPSPPQDGCRPAGEQAADGTSSERAELAGDPRTPVWSASCADPDVGNALALGMIVAAAGVYDGGSLADRYRFWPIRLDPADILADVAAAGRPGVLLLSHYVWSEAANLAVAAEVHRRHPETVIVFGGPSAPKYEQDAEDFFAAHPFAAAIARGEGEVTACELLDVLDGEVGLQAVARLAGIDGLTVRVGGDLVRAPDRARMAVLDQVPSPYLLGLFDHLDPERGIWSLETTRGCPYGCTFCDWGSATQSRVRKFDYDRVIAELDWMAAHQVRSVFIADANFGMFARDLDLTRHIAHLAGDPGYPTSVVASFAKNTTKHTVPIVRTMIDAGLFADVAIAFQTTDEVSLLNIRRKNIKLSTYEELAADVRRDGLPILADILVGLPGSSIETLKGDLQHCVDGDVTPRVFGTIVLPNSPMNDPQYRDEHQLVTDEIDQVVSCRSFDADERQEIVRFKDAFRLADHFGVLRHVLRFEAHRQDARELDILWLLYERSLGDPSRYPLLAFLFTCGRRYLTVPMSWEAYYAEVAACLVREAGALAGSELDTVLAVQRALVPAPQRAFPERVALEHDYVAFYRDVLRPIGGRAVERHLSSYGPSVLEVDDPDGVSAVALQKMGEIEWTTEGHRSLRSEGRYWETFNWELSSPLRRSLRPHYYRSDDVA